jgi:hypothetical protein
MRVRYAYQESRQRPGERDCSGERGERRCGPQAKRRGRHQRGRDERHDRSDHARRRDEAVEELVGSRIACERLE